MVLLRSFSCPLAARQWAQVRAPAGQQLEQMADVTRVHQMAALLPADADARPGCFAACVACVR